MIAVVLLFVLSGMNVQAQESEDLRLSEVIPHPGYGEVVEGEWFYTAFQITNGVLTDMLEFTLTYPVEAQFAEGFQNYVADGFCELREGKQQFVCDFGSMVLVPPGREIWVVPTFTATSSGTMVFTATVSGREPDPNLDNNTRVLNVLVREDLMKKRVFLPLCSRKG